MKTAYRNLQEFIQVLDQTGELLRIKAPVSPYLEITQITDLASKSAGGGKALLFENVEQSDFPVLTNAFGSDRRMCMALGVPDLEILAERVQKYVQMKPPRSLSDTLQLLPMGVDLLRVIPRKLKTAPCQEVVYRGAEVDLSRLPVLTCWPQDGGPFITLPVVLTRSLVTGRRNAGMYRLQVHNPNTTGMHWHIHKDGSHYYQEYRSAKKRMPVAVAIGADPATIYAATAPLPRGIDEIMLAGFIRRKPVPMVRCLTVDLEVPAEAEFILEGYVDPDELHIEGPFGDHTGYYSLVDEYPVFHVTALTHRRRPVYPATIVGRPPMEDCYLAKASERIFLPMLTAILPEVRNFWMPWEGVFHNAIVIAISKEFPGHARRVMSSIWGQGQMSFCKVVVIVDAELDLSRPDQVFRAVLNQIDPAADLYITEGVLDVLDHSAPEPVFGGKLGVDATRRVTGEKQRTRPQSPVSLLPESHSIEQAVRDTSELLTAFRVPEIEVGNRLLLLNLHKDGKITGRRLAHKLLGHTNLSAFSIFVLFDDRLDLKDHSILLWKAFNNVDPKRDITVAAGRVVIDATKKGREDDHHRPWPDDIVMDEAIVERVRKRSRELGIEEFMK